MRLEETQRPVRSGAGRGKRRQGRQLLAAGLGRNLPPAGPQSRATCGPGPLPGHGEAGGCGAGKAWRPGPAGCCSSRAGGKQTNDPLRTRTGSAACSPPERAEGSRGLVLLALLFGFLFVVFFLKKGLQARISHHIITKTTKMFLGCFLLCPESPCW